MILRLHNLLLPFYCHKDARTLSFFLSRKKRTVCHPDEGRITQEIPQTESQIFVELRV